jgi:hypothetical protein
MLWSVLADGHGDNVKSNSETETLRKGSLPKSESVRQATEDTSCVKKCKAAQIGDNARDVRKYSSDDNDKAI